ncbi:MAG: tetratricopeptide repeat protein [Methyloligellaceae bacterium]
MLSVQSVRRNLFISVFLFLIIIFQVSGASAQVGDLKNLNFQIKKNLKQGNYVQAEKLAGRAASIAGRRFGKNHPHYATAINTLGVVYQQQSKVRKAIKLHNQALRIRQSRFGNNHPAVAAILKNLGIAYTKLGQYQKALSYLNRSNKIFTRRFGASHISVAGNLNNIAKIYERMGKYEKSVQLYKKSMQIKKRRFGSKHISVMGTMRNLGQAYEQQGKLDQAMEIYRKLLDDSKRRFAANHPTRGILLGNIGRIYSKQGRIDEAIAATKQSIAIFEKSRGNRKLPLADSLNNLAISYQKKKEYKKSVPLLEKSMVLKESLFGKSHISLSSSLGNLARAYRETGQLEKSVILIKRALEIKRKYLGVRHPSYGASLSSLALIRIKQFRHPEAEKLFKQSLQISKKSLGEAHPETLQGINNFAGINMSKGEFKRAYFYLEDGVKSISSRERISGSSVITGHRATDNRFELVYRNHIRAAYGAYEKHGDIRAYLNDAAFRSAQKINSGIASSAISQMAARVTSGKPELGALVRKQQDVFQRWQRVNKALEKVIIRKETAQTRETEVRLKTELAGLKNEGDALSGRLEKEFPKYQELSNPRPLKLGEVQKLLGADELLVFYLVSRNELFIWAVSQQDSDWFRRKVSKEDLSSRIEAMRKSLDPDKLDSPDNLFDMKNSHEIYRMIFEPLVSMASGKKKILIVPSGPLAILYLKGRASLPERLLLLIKKIPDHLRTSIRRERELMRSCWETLLSHCRRRKTSFTL